MKDQLIPITIVIADRSYRIKIQPKDEEVVRKIIKLINEKVVDFKTQFAGKDTQDYIAMVLVWFATDQNTSSANWLEKENISTKLSLLEKMLDTNLTS
ncbi:MAG: cell division protein ZapA [Chitinophagaceae bacterium]|nr:MAG: cell division protein ZapA [Chitinophagaceae bacterium]